jgi:hypothetical protein
MAQPMGFGPQPRRRNELGLVSLLFGIFAAVTFWLPVVGLLLGVTAVGTGVAALPRLKRGEADNSGATVVGIVLGVLTSVVGAVIVIGLLYFFFSYQYCIDHAEGRGEYAKC